MTTARIHERGYRRYEGERSGLGAAIRTTIVDTLRRILGLRRRARHKLLPWGIAALSYLPALGFVSVILFVPDQFSELADEVLPSPRVYLGGILFLVYLAGAIAGPIALCPDRRSGALALYLASPLDRDTYLLAKAAATVAFISLVTVVPPLIYVLGAVLAGGGPDGPGAVLLDVIRVFAGGIALALLFGGLSLVAGSITERTGAAAAIVVLYAMISGAVIASVVFGLDAPDALLLLDINQVANEGVARLYGEQNNGDLGTPLVLGAMAVWIVLLFGFARWRYQKLAVTR